MYWLSLIHIYPSISGMWIAVLAAIIVCMFLGIISGIMVAQFDVPPMIATLSMMTIARGIALVYSDGQPYILNSDSFAMLGKGSVGFFPIPALIFIFTWLVFWILLNKTTYGRKIYAIGGNRKAAEASGINCKKSLVSVFAISGALAGLSGVVLASRIGSGNPSIRCV